MLAQYLCTAERQQRHQAQAEQREQHQEYGIASQRRLAGAGMSATGDGYHRGAQQTPRQKRLLCGRGPRIRVHQKLVKVAGCKHVLKGAEIKGILNLEYSLSLADAPVSWLDPRR